MMQVQSLHLIGAHTVHRLRLVLLTAATVGAQCVALADFRLSIPVTFLLGVWATEEIALKWLSG